MEQTNYEFYAYSWHVDEEYQDETFIRVYGFDDQNKNICVSLNGFRPFLWVELPTYINWKFSGNKEKLYLYFHQTFPNIKCNLKFYKKLYGANLKKNKEGKYIHKLFPFLLCSFSSYKDLKFFPAKLKNPHKIMGLGNLRFRVHGQDACPRLQLTSKYNLPTAGWIKFKGIKILEENDKFTSCDHEFLVNLRDKRLKTEEIISRSSRTTIPKPLILSFDLEVNSEDQVSMPKATRPGDVVFQISCIFSRLGSHEYVKYLLSLGNPTENIVGAIILSYSTEKELLMGFRDLVNNKNPNVITGYNIFNFDIPYLLDRSNHKAIYPEWCHQGFAKGKQGIQREIKWSSSAYKNQEFRFLDCEGRLYIDLLPVVQRDFKLDDYKLKTVSTHFIGETKDDLEPKSIFRCYREGVKNNSETASKYMSICGKYCIQDSMLVIKLFEKLNTWYSLSEMAVVCNVPMITLFTKGQQIKVYSNLYKYCLENKIIPEKDGYTVSENEKYVGAYVFPPVPGLYENVVPVDFCVSGDTLITLGNGLSKRIDQIYHDTTVISFNLEEERFLSRNSINGLQIKGEKNTVKVTMKDGREIVCTPDHKFMLANGEWCQAQYLLGKRVKCGVEFPEDVNYGDEEGYNLTIMFNSERSQYHPIHTEIWNMIEHRDKILAFARILGFIYANSLIYKNKNKVYVGNKCDVDTFQRDLTLFNCVAEVQFKTDSKGSYYRLSLPAKFACMIHSLPGITLGKRVTQPLTFPDFLMEERVPKSVIREFLGGLFGGGCAPCFSSNSKTITIYFNWDTCFPENINITFEQLRVWLNMFNLNPTTNTKISSKSQFAKEGKTSILLCFPTNEVIKYHKLIGFRYCINKSYRLTIISSYLNLRSKVSKQFDTTLTIDQYLKELEVPQIFDSYAYSVSTCFVTSFTMEVLDVNDFEKVSVYDIEVESDHNYLANGMVISNCSLYPSIIISYNIDYSTCAFDPAIPDELCHVMEWEDHISCKHDPKIIEKKRLTKTIDKLILDKNYNRTLLSQLRKQRSDITKSLNKNIMCEKRKYRFLKTTEEYPEFKGVLPTIVQSLLDTRKETRKEMNRLKDSLKTIKDEHEKKQIETTISILNQRQLAYKVSANSMYGITGVKAGMLSFMPVAMSITYMGRTNILKVADVIQTKYKGTLVAGDTDCLVETSPVLINHNGNIFYTTVNELSQGDWKPINSNKEISTPKEGYTIWSDRGFTKIENVVRCIPSEIMTKITTHIGTVICSNNHSLLTEYLEPITPQEINIGDKLCISSLPLPSDTPKRPLYTDLTTELIKNYEIINLQYRNITSNLAFIWGLFMANGSCEIYKYKKNGQIYHKYSWAINKDDIDLLNRVMKLCEEEYKTDFHTILELGTIESEKCYKLVQCNIDQAIVNYYYELFYTTINNVRYKKIPDIILQAPLEIRQAFFIGFYAGNGSKEQPGIQISFKGQIGSAQLFYLMKSLGYHVSIYTGEDKPDIYKLSGVTKVIKVPNTIKKINEYIDKGRYIYDIQTNNHHFAAGVGQLVVHNSNYVSFNHKKFTMSELWDYAIQVANEISALFPPPMKLEFEEAVYTKFLILTKKRYMYQSANRDGTIKPEIGKRGVLLNRRDNSMFIRKTYENIVKIIFENKDSLDLLKEKVISSLINDIDLMFNHQVPTDHFVITKSTGDYGKLQPQYFLNDKNLHKAMLGQYTVPFLTNEIKEQEGVVTLQDETNWYLDKLPAHIQLLEKIRRRGHSRNEGGRLEYVIVETDDFKAKQSAKIETVNYYNKNKGILNLDYLYYLQRLINPVDQILEVIFNLKDFMKIQYNNRLAKRKLTMQLNNLFSPKFEIEQDRLYLIKSRFQYFIISGSIKDVDELFFKKCQNGYEKVLQLDYIPRTQLDIYTVMKAKYGLNTTLKTQFIFKENYILLNNMPESKLISTIKRVIS